MISKLKFKMKSQSQTWTSVTRTQLTKKDASFMDIKSLFKYLIVRETIHQHIQWLNLEFMQKFNSIILTKKWLFFQEIKSVLDLVLKLPHSKELDYNQILIANNYHPQWRKDIKHQLVQDFHVTIWKLQTLLLAKTLLFTALVQMIESKWQFKVQEMYSNLIKDAVTSSQKMKTGTNYKTCF